MDMRTTAFGSGREKTMKTIKETIDSWKSACDYRGCKFLMPNYYALDDMKDPVARAYKCWVYRPYDETDRSGVIEQQLRLVFVERSEVPQELFDVPEDEREDGHIAPETEEGIRSFMDGWPESTYSNTFRKEFVSSEEHDTPIYKGEYVNVYISNDPFYSEIVEAPDSSDAPHAVVVYNTAENSVEIDLTYAKAAWLPELNARDVADCLWGDRFDKINLTYLNAVHVWGDKEKPKIGDVVKAAVHIEDALSPMSLDEIKGMTEELASTIKGAVKTPDLEVGKTDPNIEV